MMPMLQAAAREATTPACSARRRLASLSPRRLSARLARFSEKVLPSPLAMRLIAHHERRWGEPELRLLPRLVPPDAVAVDVGAAEGVYSWFLARRARQVHAFEANPESASALRRRLPGARVHACALSDHHGELELRIRVVAGVPYRGWASVQPTNSFSALPASEIRVMRVPCATLDSFGLKNVGFIKIDVEGHELAVLEGAIATLKASRPLLLIEAEDRHRPDALRLVRDFLAPLGYRGWFVDGERFMSIDGFVDNASLDASTPAHHRNNFVFRPSTPAASEEPIDG
jgi:FkbM family methyltransferase